MKKFVYTYITLSLLLIQSVLGNTLLQGNLLQGKVTDSNGNSLPGVTIYMADLRRGTVTDSLGNFRIDGLPAGKIIVNVSLIGYAAQVKLIELPVSAPLNITLPETAKEIREVVVTGSSQAVERSRTPVAIMTMNKAALQQSTATNIIDAIATQPGIHQITTGPGISKPVIRGLGYNRVLVMNDGIRQEGQQWGDEHGIEIDEFSVDKVEVLKGPASLAYGSDALAGVINMISAPTLPEGQTSGSALFNYQTNNGLFGTSFNFRGNKKGFIWDARLSSKMAHSYKNSIDDYVLNTGFRENAFTFITGLNKSWGYSHLTVSHYRIQPGIAEGERDSVTGKFLKPVRLNDTTATEEIARNNDLTSYDKMIPYQDIRHFKVVSNNSIIINGGTLKVTAGFQRNSRREFEDILHPDEYELGFLLNSIHFEAKYILPEIKKWNVTFGVSGMNQESQNEGEEFLIPEYRLFDIGGFALFRRTFNKTDISGGIRLDNRSLSSEGLFLNAEGEPVSPAAVDATAKFNSSDLSFTGFSASLGVAHQFTDKAYGKFNLSRGFRAPNIAELKSNGEHEGTIRYEYGNPNFNAETSYQADMVFGVNTDHVLIEMDLFANHIDNFVYLRRLQNVAGTDSIVDGMGAFQFDAGTANQQGGEIMTDIHPHPLDWLHIMNSFSYVRSVQPDRPDSMRFLPFTPPARYTGEIRLDKKKITNNLRNGFVKFGVDHFFDQNNVFSAFETETATPGYTLLNASFGFDLVNRKKTMMHFIFTVNNLTDEAFQNHLSRLKYAPENFANGRRGIFNMGRNISFKLVLPFGRSLS